MITAAAALRRAPSPRIAPAPIFAVASGKGGVGKTWFSATLACVWGRQGKRALLIDGDLGLANLDVQLGVRPQADLAAVLNGWIDLEAAVTPIYGGAGKTRGFDLIPGHSGSGALSQIGVEHVSRLIEGLPTLALHYDRVLIDLAAGVDKVTLRLALAADRLIVITTEEPTALTDAYAFIKLARQQNEFAVPHVIVNMAEKRASGRRIYDQLAKACEAYLGFRPPLAGVIVRDPCVPDCIRAQTALPIRHPASAAGDEVVRIGEQISG